MATTNSNENKRERPECIYLERFHPGLIDTKSRWFRKQLWLLDIDARAAKDEAMHDRHVRGWVAIDAIRRWLSSDETKEDKEDDKMRKPKTLTSARWCSHRLMLI